MRKIKSWVLFESVDEILPVGTKIKFCGKDCEIVSHKATHHNDIYYLIRYLDGKEEFIVTNDKRMKSLKSFGVFESFDGQDDVNQITSTVKDMLLELDFLDIEKRVDIVNSHSARTRAKLQRGQLVEPDIICINLWKKAIKIEGDSYRASYTWDDIKSVIEPVMEYLSSEGFEWRMDRGTLAYNAVPIISTSGSQEFDTVKSKVEMWFIR